MGWVDPWGLTAMEWAVPAAMIISQMDSPVPGPADIVAGGIIGISWLYDNVPAIINENNKELCPNKKTVGDILKGKKGSIKNAPLPKGSPSWEDFKDMPFGEVIKNAKKNIKGYKTIKKLLIDKRFNK